MDLATLFILGMLLAGMAMGAFFGLIFLFIAIYVVKNLYPPVRKVALWAARLENFLPLLILAAVLLFLMIFIGIIAFKMPAIVAILLILVLLLVLVGLVLVEMVLGLGILVYVIGIYYWLWGRYKGLLGGLLPQVMRFKIKHDLDKGTGKDKDWTTHFAEMRKKLGEEAELARRRISKGGK
jgi:hypothetical protein